MGVREGEPCVVDDDPALCLVCGPDLNPERALDSLDERASGFGIGRRAWPPPELLCSHELTLEPDGVESLTPVVEDVKRITRLEDVFARLPRNGPSMGG